MFIDVCALRSKLKLKFHYPNDIMAFELKECIAKSSFSSGHLIHVVVLIGFRNY